MNGFERTFYAVAAWFAKEMAARRKNQAGKWAARAESWAKRAKAPSADKSLGA